MRNDVNRKMITQEQYLELKGDVDQLKNDVDQLKGDVDQLKNDVDRRFDKVDGRLDNLHNWMIGTGLTIIITIIATVGTFTTMVTFSINSVS